MREGFVYLDNNATTRIAPEAYEAMKPFLCGPSPAEAAARAAVKLAREHIAALIRARPDEIFFTSGGTESDNAALNSMPDGRLVTTAVEHAAILRPAMRRHQAGQPVDFLLVDTDGRIDIDCFRETARSAAGISVMWANNETGVLFPVAEMAAIAAEQGAVFHTDAVQAIGKVIVDVSAVPIDCMSISGHKIHAPKGVGALFIRRGSRSRFASAEYCGVAHIVAFGEAARLTALTLDDSAPRISALRRRFERGILNSCDRFQLLGDGAPRLPNTTSIVFDGISGEAVVMDLDRLGVVAGSGSACASGLTEPSHVLLAMGIEPERALGTVRFSLSDLTTDDDVTRVLEVLPGVLRRLRKRAAFGLELGPRPECKD